MTCRQLGGACDKLFSGATFSELARLSKQHGNEMIKMGDVDHLRAMEKMRALLQDPDAIHDWLEQKKTQFELLPEE